MAFTSLCLLICCLSAATASVQINVAPDQSQFFRYDRIILRCVGNSSGWIVKRNTTYQTAQECEKGWATPRESSCIIDNAYPEDTGVYWCESPGGESNTININVTGLSVILKSSVLPVMEGDDVPLECFYKEEDEHETSNFNASFSKDGVFIGTKKSGKMTLRKVRKSKDEGFYKCHHPAGTNSPQTWLTVRARPEQDPDITPPPPSPPPPPFISLTKLICGILLFIIYNIILIFCFYRYCKWIKARAQAKRTSFNQGLIGGKKC